MHSIIIDQKTVNQITTDKMAVGKMPVGEMTVGEMLWCQFKRLRLFFVIGLLSLCIQIQRNTEDQYYKTF